MENTLFAGPKTLGAFLRAQREKTAPADIGLPAQGRRRTCGLRREEVAQLSGISTTWYTWIEQGVTSSCRRKPCRILRAY